MIREVLILALIITFGSAQGQDQPGSLQPKELTIKKVVQNGYESEIDAPSDFVRRELWRQVKTVARVQTYGDILEIHMPAEDGELLLYGVVASVQDSKTFLALVTAHANVDSYVKETLLQLRKKILLAYYQGQIEKLEKESSTISRRLQKKASTSDSTLFEQLTEINAEIESLRAKQLNIF